MKKKYIKPKDIKGKFDLKVEAGEPNDDLMLFGKTKYELAIDVCNGKIKIDTIMNEWYRRYCKDLLDQPNQ